MDGIIHLIAFNNTDYLSYRVVGEHIVVDRSNYDSSLGVNMIFAASFVCVCVFVCLGVNVCVCVCVCVL
jgi:hypothetical protein